MGQEWRWAGPVSKNTALERKRKTKQRDALPIPTKTKTKFSVWTRSTLFSFANRISLFRAPKRLETTACFWGMSEKRGIRRIGAMFYDSSAILATLSSLLSTSLNLSPSLGPSFSSFFLFAFFSSIAWFPHFLKNKGLSTSGGDILRSQGSNSKQRYNARMVRWRWRRRRSSCQVRKQA